MIFRNRPVAILFFTLFVVMLGFGVIIPVLPFYVLELGATALDLGLLMATFSLMQFICAPYWGSLSDRIGRRPVLLVGLAGYVVSFLIMAFSNALWMLFVARILGGALSAATLPTALAYIGDTTARHDRGSGMGVLGAAMGMGVVFGPAIGGGLTGFGIMAPFFFSAALSALVWCFAYFALPESLVRGAREGAASGPWQARLGRLAAVVRGPLVVYFALAFIMSFGAANLESVFAFFAHDRLGYGPPQMGMMFVVMGVTMVLLQGLAVGRLINRYGEERLLLAGLLISAGGLVLVTRAFDTPSMLAFVMLLSIGLGLLRPTIASLLSKRTRVGQGTTMGLQGSFDSLGRVAGPVWGGYLYQYGIDLPYLSGAAVFLLALGILAVTTMAGGVPQDLAGGPGDGPS